MLQLNDSIGRRGGEREGQRTDGYPAERAASNYKMELAVQNFLYVNFWHFSQ